MLPTVFLFLLFHTIALADYWTLWLDRDDPAAGGDWETVSGAIYWGLLSPDCYRPLAVQARIRDYPNGLVGQPGDVRNKLHYYDHINGVVCRSEDQVVTIDDYDPDYYNYYDSDDIGIPFPNVPQYGEPCHNYQVSFLCPGNRPPPSIGRINPVNGTSGNSGRAGGVQTNGDVVFNKGAANKDEGIEKGSSGKGKGKGKGKGRGV